MLKSFVVPAFFSFFLFFISVAEASHGRYMHTTWQRVSDNQDGSVTVRFTVTTGWGNFHSNLMIAFGDGATFTPNDAENPQFFDSVDANSNPYTLRRYTVEHTYSEADILANDGRFEASHNLCCRVTVENQAGGGDRQMRLLTGVDLNNGNKGSATSNAPAILQVQTGEVNVLPIPFSDPDGDEIKCRFGDELAHADAGAMVFPDSDLPELAELNGVSIEVSDDCVVTWDLTDATLADVGKRFAVQVMLEEINRCHNGDCSRAGVDFLIEVVEGPLPVCSINKPVNNNVYVDVLFEIELTGVAGPLGESDYNYFFNGLPDDAVVSPPAGTVSASPFTTVISWTPGLEDLGTSYVVLAGLIDEDQLQSFCSFSMNVQEVPDLECSEVDITTEQFSMDGNALLQRDLIHRSSRRLARLGVRSSLINNVRQRADALYEEAWSATWLIPSSMDVCGNDTFCEDVSNQPEIDSYLELVGNLDAVLKKNIRRIRRLGAPRRAVRRLRLQSNTLVEAATSISQDIPEFRSVCSV